MSYEVIRGEEGVYPEYTIRCTENGRTMTMWADEALGVGRVLAGEDIERLTRERDEARAAARRAILSERAMEAEVERLRAFALSIIRHEFDGASECGEWIMDYAIKAGLVERIVHDDEDSAIACEICAEFGGAAGDWHFELTPAYREGGDA